MPSGESDHSGRIPRDRSQVKLVDCKHFGWGIPYLESITSRVELANLPWDLYVKTYFGIVDFNFGRAVCKPTINAALNEFFEATWQLFKMHRSISSDR